MNIEERLKELGLELPALAAAAGNYLPYVRVGDMIYLSGQLPFLKGALTHKGKVGAEVSLEEAQQAARTCTLNGLALLREAAGSLDKIAMVRVGGFVASASGFTDQPKVINGASDLLVQILGENGKHARAAVGVFELPLGVPVEIEFTARIL
ncbi:MAG TPA: LysR family transcriptional regulator [Cyanobacteria bacterium UBA8530]|nr:LysR family transcriptional regulator [Cyanobacteria bacterium UBA8530]